MADEQNLDNQSAELNESGDAGVNEDLAARVQSLEEQLAAAQDQSLRVAAELQNIRRRAEQDVEKAHKFALEKFAGDLLGVVDSLERGLELSSPGDESIKPMREGLELTLKLLLDTLARYQVASVDPHGEPFNPELERGMTVVTGETGAGKSIMLDALGLALGDRADSGVVRPGADKADILASFDLDDIPSAREWLQERDLEGDGPCILRRVITAEGRSRGYINGTPCPQSDLKALGERLIDIHSQHEHQSLLKPDTHRRLLDEYSGSQELARQVQLAAQRWRQTRQSLERLSSSSDEQRARHQLLSYQLEELENLALGENELDQLEHEHKTLTNSEQLLGACRQVIELCGESDAGNVLSALTSSLQRLTAFRQPPAALAEAVTLLGSAQIQVEEAMA